MFHVQNVKLLFAAETSTVEASEASCGNDTDAEVIRQNDVQDGEPRVEEAIDHPLEVKTVNGTSLTATENLDSPDMGEY